MATEENQEELHDEVPENEEAVDESPEDDRQGKESVPSEAEEVEAAETDEERETIRARRRQERHDRKAAAKEREESLRREIASRDHIINDIQGRLNAMERKGQGADVAQIDSAIKQSADAYNYYKEQIAVAARNQDGVTLADATEKMIVSQRRYEDLTKMKNTVAQQATKPAPLDPRVASLAKNWLERNKWYNPTSADEDSLIAGDIDKRMSQSGWNPGTPQYWDELDSRLKKYLPHRYKAGYNKNNGSSAPTRSPVAGSGGPSAPSTNGSSFKLSAERVEALKASGNWEDPAKREKMIQYYKNFDKQRTAVSR